MTIAFNFWGRWGLGRVGIHDNLYSNRAHISGLFAP